MDEAELIDTLAARGDFGAIWRGAETASRGYFAREIGELQLPRQRSSVSSVATEPATTHVPPLLGEAIWARALGGQATELQPVNPFTIGRMASCHLLAERFEDQAERDAQHEDASS